jgi:conjugative relaxase-like TrwC/TraI family protein
MLRFYTATDSAAAKNYFNVSDYYSEGQEIVGRWSGKLAAELGLDGPVDKHGFDALCDNKRPDGARLTPRTNEFRRVGEDMIFSLPKEVGAFLMLLPDAEREAMLGAVERRVYQVASLIEADIETRVRIGDAFENRPGDGLAFAAFFHSTARPVAGQAPDPHPHWHLFAFNATNDREEGRIKAADFAAIYRDRTYYEACFYSLVAEDFAEAGYPIDRRADGKWGFTGLQAFGARYSKRTDEIEEEARRLGITDALRKSELGAKTRSGKQKELTREELQKDWLSQLSHDEWHAFDAVQQKELPPAPEISAREAVSFALKHLSERQSVFPERELVRVALLHGLGSVSVEAIRAELPNQGVICSMRNGRLMATTEALQAEEDFIVCRAHSARSVAPVGIPEGLSRKLENGKQLNDGQWQAVTSLLNSACRVSLIEGPAGAGKSSLLAKFDEAMRMSGETVTYLATTSKAAEVLQEDGFDAHTLARFLVDERMQKAAAGGRVVIDESSMLGHKDAVRLYRLAESLDLKLIHLGDPMQHGSVPRGAFHSLLKEHAGIKPFKLTEIMRQQDRGYLEAAKLLSDGKTLEGIDVLQAKGWVHEIADPAERYQKIANEYLESIDQKKTVLVVSPTHAEAGRITDAIRSKLRQSGRLGEEERSFSRLVASGTTEAERSQEPTYQPGQVIQFFQNAKGGFTKGDRLEVTDPKSLPLDQAGKFQLFDRQEIRLSAGDQIRFTASVRSLDGRKLYRNGSVATVTGFDRQGNIRLKDGKAISKEAGHFRHAFVETSFGAQGQTHQRVILGMGAVSTPAMSQEQAYVSLTRGKERASVYTDDLTAMRKAVQHSSQKLAALELRPEPPEPKPVEKQRATLAERLRRHLERQRQRAFFARLRAVWDVSAFNPLRQPVRAATHAERLRSTFQEQERSYGR